MYHRSRTVDRRHQRGFVANSSRAAPTPTTLNGPQAVLAGRSNKTLNETKTLHRFSPTPITHRARNPERPAARQTTVALFEHGLNLRPVTPR